MSSYVIKPNYSSLADELIEFIKNDSSKRQAIVLACLDFLRIRTLNEIMAHLSLNPRYVLKSLIEAEKRGLVVFINDGWIARMKPKAPLLNDYLSLEINEDELEQNKKTKRLLNSLSETLTADAAPERKDSGTLNLEPTIHTIGLETSKISEPSYYLRNDDMDPERIKFGSTHHGVSKWSDNQSLQLNRQIRKMVDEKNNERHVDEQKEKIAKIRKPTKEEETAERLYVKLCVLFPEYESMIDTRYEEDSSIENLLILHSEIINLIKNNSEYDVQEQKDSLVSTIETKKYKSIKIN